MASTTEKGSEVNLPLDGGRLNALTGILCDGMFSYADEEKATQIIAECRKVCDGIKDAELSQVLQTKYVSNHTPFFWVIANLPQSERSKPQRTIPPLLTELLKICGDLLDETQNDIVQGLFVNSDDPLYQLIRPRLPSFATPPPKRFFQAESDQTEYSVSIPTAPQQSYFELTFSIPRFYDRIIIDKEVSYHFVAIGSLWRFAAIATPEASESAWHFELAETYSSKELPTSHQYKSTIEAKITWPIDTSPSKAVYIPPTLQHPVSRDTGVRVETTYSTIPNSTIVDLKHRALSKLYAHPLISQSNRALTGVITVHKSVIEPALKKNLTLGLFSAK
ncbi:hypothetical protein MD484_g478, partial [Candolleomyces efflorescens]